MKDTAKTSVSTIKNALFQSKGDHGSEKETAEVREVSSLSEVNKYNGYPLVQSMIRYEAVRNAFLENEGKDQMNYPMSNEGWVKCLFIIRGRALDWGVLPWTVAVLHATIYTIIQELVFDVQERDLASWEFFFGIVLNSTLSFLLVFRLNRAAGRFWSARGMWGTLVARGRTIVSGLLVHGKHDPDNRDDAIRLLGAFAVATMEFLRGIDELPSEAFAGILTEEEVQKVQENKHPPLYIGDRMRYHLNELFQIDENTSVSQATAWTQKLVTLEQQLNEMIDTCGGMERIRGTPLPMVYVSHLRTFLMLSLILLPYVWGPAWNWFTIPLVAVTAFALLGIDCASAEVECPFRQDRTNALNMDSYCIGLLATIQQQVKNDADRDIESRNQEKNKTQS